MPSINSSQYIRSRLTKNTEEDVFTTEVSPNDSIFSSPVAERVEDIVLKGATGLKGTIYRFLFKHKDMFKKIPVLGKYLVARKNRIFAANKNAIDFSDLFSVGLFRFIGEVYIRAFGREAQRSDLIGYASLYMNGLSKEGIVYIVCSGAEFNNRAAVIGLKLYRRHYRKYRFKCALRKIPIIGSFFNLLFMPQAMSICIDMFDYINDRLDWNDYLVANNKNGIDSVITTLKDKGV